jgi:hypothetical protein
MHFRTLSGYAKVHKVSYTGAPKARLVTQNGHRNDEFCAPDHGISRYFAILTNREEWIMIVIRNVFRLKFGKAREAVALFKEGIAIQKRIGGADFSTRLLTDVTGPFYTVVLEIVVPSLAAFEAEAPRIMGDKDWQANYQKSTALVESGYREIFTLIE